eukprot:157004_1
MSYQLHTSPRTIDSVISFIAPLTPKSKVPKLLRIQFIVIIISIAIIAAIYWNTTVSFLQITLKWITDHLFIGSIVLLLLLIIASITGIPSSIIAIGCGFIYYQQLRLPGVLLAILIVWIGCCLGAIISFFMSRYLFRDCILRFAQNNTKFTVIEAIINQHGIKIAMLMRLTPVIPFFLENYVMGVTSIKPMHYIISLVAIFPGSIIWPIVGSTVSRLTDIAKVESSISKSPQILIILSISAVIAIIIVITFMIKVRKQFQILEQQVINQQFDFDGSEVELQDIINQKTDDADPSIDSEHSQTLTTKNKPLRIECRVVKLMADSKNS